MSSHHSTESSGIAQVSKVKNEVDISAVHLLQDHVSCVEGIWLYVVEQKEASILFTTSHVWVNKVEKVTTQRTGCGYHMTPD